MASTTILIPGVGTATWSGVSLLTEDGRTLAWRTDGEMHLNSALGSVESGLVRTALHCLAKRGFTIPGFAAGEG